MRGTVAARFWAKMQKAEGCWLWTGGTIPEGYGSFDFYGRATGAHRVSWILNYGLIPNEQKVLHKCDNRRCVRPDHLFPGTVKVNNQDCVSKDRHSRGERHGLAKLTDEAVLDIRSRYAKGCPVNGGATLAKEYGVSYSLIGKVTHKHVWKHLP